MVKPTNLALGGAVLVAAVAGAIVGSTSSGVAATQARPDNLDPPTISGKAQVGSVLTADPGRWSGSPTDFDYRWRRCDQNGGSCSSISGATRKDYELKAVDRGNTLRVAVTARNADGSATATSVPTAVVQEAPPPPATTGCARPGQSTVPVTELGKSDRLLIDRQGIEPEVVRGSTETVTVRFRVSACSGRPVQGALVYATAVPYNQFDVPPEATSGADGYASLTMRRLRGFPATPRQELLVIFVRARRAGESELAGISTRRLVSFPVDLR